MGLRRRKVARKILKGIRKGAKKSLQEARKGIGTVRAIGSGFTPQQFITGFQNGRLVKVRKKRRMKGKRIVIVIKK